MSFTCIFAISATSSASAQPGHTTDRPRSHDPRLIVERFAAAPDIVHPVSIVCDSRGRLLVIESHTHFRPSDYKGPAHDRIRVLEDTDGDGKADRFTTFFEGTRSTMDIALHPDGSIYLATRNEVLRLRDTKGIGKADQSERIVFLDTKGNYPHNGLSGVCFDSKGDLYFGMGENMGENYRLIGSDGNIIKGGGEGGNIFWCTADGKKLRRVATGFWNPFGVCIDIFGRIFAVDNDPDAMPPCRLLHVVQGGDYGYQYRYGRSGRHPFQSWNGQLPGTLPMASGTGEAPCEVISYESDGLPPEYLGNLLVASWADHRIERYIVKEHGASVVAERLPFVQGGKDFRPVGIAVAPDGSLYVSDWVLSNYNLHGRGAIWHIRRRHAAGPDRPGNPKTGLTSRHRPLREVAATQLVSTENGRNFLRGKVDAPDVRVRAAALTALIDVGDRQIDLARIGSHDSVPAMRALAVRALVARGADVSRFLESNQPASVRAAAIAGCKDKSVLHSLLLNADPFLRHAAVQKLAKSAALLTKDDLDKATDSRLRVGLLLAFRDSDRPEDIAMLPRFLQDRDPDVRFLAAKWIADEKLSAFRSALIKGMADPALNIRLYSAYATALARIDNRDVNETRMADYFVGRLASHTAARQTRIAALRLVPSTHPKLTVDVLTALLAEKDEHLQLEAVRALNDRPVGQRLPILLKLAQDATRAEAVRAEAVTGIDHQAPNAVTVLLSLLKRNKGLRDEALRSLTGAKLDAAGCEAIESAGAEANTKDLAARALGKPFATYRPRPEQLSAWRKLLEGPADPAAGRRVFFHPKLAGCYRCHRVGGRGQDIGPDLSAIGRTERSHILESILQPNNLVAPHYQVWSLVTHAGRVYTGMLIRTVLDEYTYVDANGTPFKLNTRDIAETRAVPGSIMPGGLVDVLTDQEIRDLLAYLCSRR